MANQSRDPFGARDTFDTGHGQAGIYRLARLVQNGLCRVAVLPFSIRILLEACLRQCDGYQVTELHVRDVGGWRPESVPEIEIPS